MATSFRYNSEHGAIDVVPTRSTRSATSVFTDDQYRAVAWTITMINAFNRLSVTSRKPLPPGPEA